MSFVPTTGPATFRPAEPPREGTVEFSDDRRSVVLPIRAALPILTKAQARDDTHPSVALLAGAALLGLRLVAAGKLEPAPTAVPSWRVAPLDADDRERVSLLAGGRGAVGLDPAAASALVRDVLAAVVDAVPRTAPGPATPEPAPDFRARLRRRIEQHREEPPDRRPQLVAVSLRVEADEEELVGGAVRLVLQVHDEQDPLHVSDAAVLWAESGPDASHGFGDRARTHATIALRAAAEAWPVLDRMLELRVPDQITLDGAEIASLLEDGVAALRDRGVDVLWPRSLGRDLTTRAVLDRAPSPSDGPREEPLQTGLFGAGEMFAFNWQVALHGDPLTDEEMEQLAQSASPLLKLRGSWTVIDPAVARRARKRLLRRITAGEAVAATLTGTALVPTPGGEAEATEVIVGATLLKVRERLAAAATREPVPVPEALRATLRDYQRQGLTWLAEMTDLGLGACLADDMGLGKTITLIALHLHRVAEGATGPTLVVCPASLLGNWEAEIERFAPGTAVRRFHGGQRSLEGLNEADLLSGGGPGFVLTTYGTMRVSAEELAAVPWDLVVADEAQHVKNPRSSTARALRAVPSVGRVALTGTPVENDLTELWAILDWATPGLLGSRNAFRKVWAAPIESGLEPTKAKQFAELVGPFLLRRRKSDPGIAPELPPKTETDHPLRLTREQTVLYEAFVRDTMERIERADEDARRGLVLMLLTGLKQICNHPAHFLKQSGAARLAGRSEKLDLLDELLATALSEDGAVLVFTQYVAMGHLLESHLARTGVPHQFLHGGVPVRQRDAMVRAFQAGETPVFLLSLKAGGTGLNLTRADHVVHLDRWWNPAVEDQATDRAYRIGQTKPVQVHRMITRGTIEEKVAELLTRKRALADAVLGRGEAALTELSNDELRDLVTLRST
ncbi:DEAD/DEAH box helicase [Nocardioides lianchengensis]|uniref:Superfamily II DNA or RNA helicase, SNF2 family n=1 Tax=Nocardioides lianchengensis TaxID=1045774 RepID=A0A1G6M1L5_9ACTN|nr:DEAD/DEAH box helicase [Nocardioides lianchengensis]NYG12380.1 superfamily II DNA or RNA helicase [Nocardioides lianchengensis]SDC49360.1 Superfamily II DNA or RNA helicase, SNF2 family [Nocardioides lianchengensis]